MCANLANITYKYNQFFYSIFSSTTTGLLPIASINGEFLENAAIERVFDPVKPIGQQNPDWHRHAKLPLELAND